jgi:hypothetical protein
MRDELAVPVQPFVFVTVTVYAPARLTVMPGVPSPVDQLYTANGPLLRLILAVSPAHIGAKAVMAGFAAGLVVTVVDSVPVQPKTSVTVTVYIPALVTVAWFVLLTPPDQL